MHKSDGTVLTIGHSTHPLEVFISLLRRHGVTAVADVRATPYSRFNAQFNREPLAERLAELEISYVFLGMELGGRSDDPACYAEGRISYERLGRTGLFQQGLRRVVRGSARHRIALMCAEKEPLKCHRSLLVAPALDAMGVSVIHIGAAGEPECHADAMERLLVMHSLQDIAERQRLFPRSRAERLAEAIARQAGRFAYRNNDLASDPGSERSQSEVRT